MSEGAVAGRSERAARSLALVRAAAVVAGLLAYHGSTPPAARHGAALAVAAASVLYAAAVVALAWSRRLPGLLEGHATTVGDGALVAAAVLVTGGAASPFHVLWYLAVVGVALRHGARASVVAALAYGASHAAVLHATGDLASRPGDLLLGVAVLGGVGVVAALLARESSADARAKEDMEGRMRAARTAEEKFRGLLEAAPDAIVIVDGGGRIVLVNSAVESMFGYARRDVLGKPIETLIMGAGRDRYGLRRDGTGFPVEVSLSPLRTSDGLLVTSVIRDVTERRRAEEERVKSVEQVKELERLKELDRFKTQFINMAAHELGTPLTPIKLQLHLMRMVGSGEMNEQQRKAFDILDRNVDRLTELVADVLDVARIQANRLGVKKERMSLDRLVREAVESYEEPARQAGIAMEARIAPDLVVDADPKRLHEVLLNLLSNAVKFTPRGGRIVVEAREEAGAILVRVRDTGVGLTREQAARLFQPFSQAHDAMPTTLPGSGLGLFICKGLVELHGGRISAESPGAGRGAVFSFTIPLGGEASTTAPEAASSSRAGRARELI